MPTEVETRQQATAEQLSAMTRQLLKQLIRSKQAPMDFLGNYLFSLVLTKLVWCMLSQITLVRHLNDGRAAYDANIKSIASYSMNDQYQVMMQYRKAFSYVPSLPEKCNDKRGFDILMHQFSNALPGGHAYHTQYPPEGIAKRSSVILNKYLTNYPLEDAEIAQPFKNLLNSTKTRDMMRTAFKHEKSKIISIKGKAALLNAYNYLCKKVNIIELLGDMHAHSQLYDVVRAVGHMIVQTFFLLAQGNMPAKLLPSVSFPLQVSPEKRITLSTVDALNNLNENEMAQYYVALCKLKQHSISWDKIFNRVLGMLLPILTVLLLFTRSKNLMYSLGSLFMPIIFSLISATKQQLFSLLGSLKPTQYYVNIAKDWLGSALLLDSTLSEQVSLTKIDGHDISANLSDDGLQNHALQDDIELTFDWDQIQFEISPVNAPSQDINPQSILAMMLVIIKMLERFNIDYIVVGKKSEEVAAVYVRVADVYDKFSSSIGRKGRSVQQCRELLEIEYKKMTRRLRVEGLLNSFKSDNLILAYWLFDCPGLNLKCVFNIPDGIKLSSDFIKDNDLGLDVGSYYVNLFGMNDDDVMNRLESIFQKINELRIAARAARAAEIARLPRPSRTIHPMQSRGLLSHRQKKHLKAANPRPTISSEVSTRDDVNTDAVPCWSVGEHQYSASDNNVYMIQGTQTYTNPLYVVGDISPYRFKSPYTALRVNDVIKTARYARPRDQAGLFAIGGALEVKVLGQHAQGDVRCRADRYYDASNSGSRLYVVNKIIEGSHGPRTQKKFH